MKTISEIMKVDEFFERAELSKTLKAKDVEKLVMSSKAYDFYDKVKLLSIQHIKDFYFLLTLDAWEGGNKDKIKLRMQVTITLDGKDFAFTTRIDDEYQN